MVGEGTSFLSQSNSNDDLDIELMDERLELVPGVERGRFGLILRLATTATLACTLGLVFASLAQHEPRSHWTRTELGHEPRTGAVRQTVELDGLPPQASLRSLLKPVEAMHDGNPCDANEELYGGLCYKQCNLLTQGEAPIRTSSWTCCEDHPCTFSNQRGSIGHSFLCTGFDVNGEGGCPHKAGACLLDEELHLGICFKKCSLLTEGKFPYRVAAATCCKTQGLGCLDVFNDKTDNRFNVGGGNDDHDPSTPAEAHPPDESWTESGDAPATTATTTPSPSQFVQDAHFEPVEHLHDGNVCDDSEELYGGLCYQKCGVLTNGVAPIRTSSWTCCESHPCGLWNQKGSIGHSLICKGFDVAADGSCPHKPGACLVNEELLLGVCYEKCSLLSNGAFPYRLTAATCCKDHGLGCLNPRNDMTSDSFDTGGGGNGEDDSQAHLPDETLTEAGPQASGPQTELWGSSVPPAQTMTQRQGLADTASEAPVVSVHSQPEESQLVGKQGTLHLTSGVVRERQQQLPFGSSLRTVSNEYVPQSETDESKAAMEAKKAREAQAAVEEVMRAMK